MINKQKINATYAGLAPVYTIYMTEEQRNAWNDHLAFLDGCAGLTGFQTLAIAANAHLRELEARLRECDCPCCCGTGKAIEAEVCSECKGTGKMCLAYETARGHEKLGRARIRELEARVAELESDFESCEKEVAEVYLALTNNKFSKMNTRAQVILDEAEAEAQRAIAEAIGVEHEYAVHLEARVKGLEALIKEDNCGSARVYAEAKRIREREAQPSKKLE